MLVRHKIMRTISVPRVLTVWSPGHMPMRLQVMAPVAEIRTRPNGTAVGRFRVVGAQRWDARARGVSQKRHLNTVEPRAEGWIGLAGEAGLAYAPPR